MNSVAMWRGGLEDRWAACLQAGDPRRGVPVHEEKIDSFCGPAVLGKPLCERIACGKDRTYRRAFADIFVELECGFAEILHLVQRLMVSSHLIFTVLIDRMLPIAWNSHYFNAQSSISFAG